MIVGEPEAVGSGCKSLKYKGHAFTHSCRLITSSWKKAVALVNSNFTTVGDLGELFLTVDEVVV